MDLLTVTARAKAVAMAQDGQHLPTIILWGDGEGLEMPIIGDPGDKAAAILFFAGRKWAQEFKQRVRCFFAVCVAEIEGRYCLTVSQVTAQGTRLTEHHLMYQVLRVGGTIDLLSLPPPTDLHSIAFAFALGYNSAATMSDADVQRYSGKPPFDGESPIFGPYKDF